MTLSQGLVSALKPDQIWQSNTLRPRRNTWGLGGAQSQGSESAFKPDQIWHSNTLRPRRITGGPGGAQSQGPVSVLKSDHNTDQIWPTLVPSPTCVDIHAGSQGQGMRPRSRTVQQRTLSKRERKRLREAEERRRELESLKPFAFDPKRDTTLGAYFEVGASGRDAPEASADSHGPMASTQACADSHGPMASTQACADSHGPMASTQAVLGSTLAVRASGETQ